MAKHRKTNLLRESAKALPLRDETEWFRARLLEWAKENGRDFPWRHTDSEYCIVVTEILLQQTTAAAVAKLYEPFFSQFPTWQSLHDAPLEAVKDAIRVLGLWDRRSRSLKALAAWVAEHRWALPTSRDELEEVPGIGQYVASVLLAVKYGQPEPMLDVNMARVLERFFGGRELADMRDDPWLQELGRSAAGGTRLGWACLDLASAVCKSRRPVCRECPAARGCQSNQAAAGTW